MQMIVFEENRLLSPSSTFCAVNLCYGKFTAESMKVLNARNALASEKNGIQNIVVSESVHVTQVAVGVQSSIFDISFHD